jgi:hypothetical protein
MEHLKELGKLPRLKNPMTFNEKIAWRKLNQRDPRFRIFADKVAVKGEIEKLIGKRHLIETLLVVDDPEKIPFESIEPPYVIKVNHTSGYHFFIKAENDIDRDKIIASLQKQLKQSYDRFHREWGYSGIAPKVIIERMIFGPDGEIPHDLKFFVYHGRVHFIQLDRDRFGSHTREIYDRDWNFLPVQYIYAPASIAAKRPANLKKMIELAEKIGAQFDFVRVDLYSTAKGIFFGETTFYPEAGLGRFSPHEWDFMFGEPWKIGSAVET